jgi:hypothetical protein
MSSRETLSGVRAVLCALYSVRHCFGFAGVHVEKLSQEGTAKPQISPLRFAPVEMTKGRGVLSERPSRHSRAGLWIVPSLTGLLAFGRGPSRHSRAGLWIVPSLTGLLAFRVALSGAPVPGYGL